MGVRTCDLTVELIDFYGGNTWPPKLHKMNKWIKKLKRLSCPAQCSKDQRVHKLFGGIMKIPECLKMVFKYFSQYPCKNSDVTILFGYSRYQINKVAKYLTFTGSMSCSKYLCSNAQYIFLKKCYL